MPYRFKHGETFQDGLLRIGIEQFNRARTTLKHDAADKAVHETRKCIKRLRALLRLVRSGIGEAAFNAENKRLGDIARSLSGVRDQTVLLATLGRLGAHHPEFTRLKSSLEADLIALPAEAHSQALKGRMDATLDDIGAADVAWTSLVLAHDTYTPIGEGLARGLRDLQKFSEAAGNDDDAAHDWRKAAQRHWRHMRLLEPGWPAYFQVRALESKAVSDLLGDAQDLALLVRWIGELPADHLSKTKARAVVKLAKREQAGLRAEALVRTQRLTAERPQSHARRAGEYWGAAAQLPTVTGADAGAAGEADVSEPASVAAHKAKASPRKQSTAVASRKPPSPARGKALKGGKHKPRSQD